MKNRNSLIKLSYLNSSVLMLVIALFISNSAFSSNEYIKSKTKGILIGGAFSNEQLEGAKHYVPIQFIYKYNYPIFRNPNFRRSNLFLHLEPQFNLVIIGSKLDAFETGINLGITYNYLINQNSIVFIGLAAGPHFISIETIKLAKGFTFSDNFMLGLRKKIKFKNAYYEFEIQGRFRHMSNAGLKQPTAGIDAFLLMIGISKLF